MRKRGQESSLTRFKEYLADYLKSVESVVIPLKNSRLAELHLNDQIEDYEDENGAIELCYQIIEKHTDKIKLFLTNVSESSINDESLERLMTYVGDIGRVSSVLRLFSRVKKYDYENKGYDVYEFHTPEALFKGTEQIVDHIDSGFENLSDAIDELKDLMKIRNNVEELELIEANN